MSETLQWQEGAPDAAALPGPAPAVDTTAAPSAFDAAGPAETTIAPAWAAVFSLTLGVFGLVTAEFLPASLLTPMAADLGISEGAAGQAVTATAAVALVASLLVSAATRRLDRRIVLLAFTLLLIVSNLLVAFAPDLASLIVGRVLLGAALGGFWAMSAALAMRLVPEALVPRALSIMFSGVSAATIFAAPVGSYVGDLLGWRAVFLIAAGLAVATLAFQLATLPKMPPAGTAGLRTLVEVLRRPRIGIGLFSALLVFAGHFAFFTYIRPFLETVTGVGISAVSGILLGFGVANFAGTLLAGPVLERSLRLALVSMPLLMGALGLGLATLQSTPLADLADGGGLGPRLRRGAGRLVDLAHPHRARPGRDRRRPPGGGGAARHLHRRGRRRRHLRRQRRTGGVRRRQRGAAGRGADHPRRRALASDAGLTQ